MELKLLPITLGRNIEFKPSGASISTIISKSSHHCPVIVFPSKLEIPLLLRRYIGTASKLVASRPSRVVDAPSRSDCAAEVLHESQTYRLLFRWKTLYRILSPLRCTLHNVDIRNFTAAYRSVDIRQTINRTVGSGIDITKQAVTYDSGGRKHNWCKSNK
jgi:hypothetical protein